jgi:DNA-binding beta-propeller fold protein YncE
MTRRRIRLLLQWFIVAIAAAGFCACSGGGLSSDRNIPNASASRMNVAARAGVLLYVSDFFTGTVSVYSYPDLTPVGTLTGFLAPAGLCVDARNGNLWVTDELNSTISEFAHGGTTPIATLAYNDEYIGACAIDPKSVDLAVASTSFGGDDPGNLGVFENARGVPKTYFDRHFQAVDFVGYDGAGNALLDGFANVGGARFRLAELAKGNRRITDIAWKGPRIGSPGGVQYDGTTLAIGDAAKAVIYQTSNGVVLGKSLFKGACTVSQFFIYHRHVIVPSYCGSSGDVLIYDYPAGGAPIAKLSGFTYPFGAVISR